MVECIFTQCDLQEDKTPQWDGTENIGSYYQNSDNSVKPKWLLQRPCDYQRNDDSGLILLCCTKSQMNLKKKNLWSNCLTVTKNACIHVQNCCLEAISC